jgi:hypothetical protein
MIMIDTDAEKPIEQMADHELQLLAYGSGPVDTSRYGEALDEIRHRTRQRDIARSAGPAAPGGPSAWDRMAAAGRAEINRHVPMSAAEQARLAAARTRNEARMERETAAARQALADDVARDLAVHAADGVYVTGQRGVTGQGGWEQMAERAQAANQPIGGRDDLAYENRALGTPDARRL